MNDVDDKVYTFDELSPRAQEKALDKARDWNVIDHGWWECTYEDATRIGAMLGIEIDARSVSFELDVGLCFSGSYTFAPDAIAKVKSEAPIDSTLHALSEALTVASMTYMIETGDELCVHISSTSWRQIYTLSFSMDSCSYYEADVPEAIESAINSFAEWFLQNLQNEYDYLTSDERLKEMFADNDYKFDEDGSII